MPLLPESALLLPSEKPLNLLHILIIDNDVEDQEALKRAVLQAEPTVTIGAAGTAKEGLALLLTHTYDAIFMDFKLPDMEGLELLQQIRARGTQAPVIVVTSYGDERVAAKAILQGAADYIPKSLVTPDGISHSIRTAIRLQNTERSRASAEQQLKTAQHHLNFVISQTPTAFITTDKAGTVINAYGMGFRKINIEPEYLLGQHYSQVFAIYPRIRQRLSRGLNGENIESVDKAGDTYFKAHYVPVLDDLQQVIGVTVFAIDITDRILIEQELTKAKNMAEESVRIKEQFIANISHEIRTPMNGIIGLTNVLQKSNLEAEQRRFLTAIQTSADTLMYIINDLLDFSKLAARQFSFEQVLFNLPELLESIEQIIAFKIQENQNRYTCSIAGQVPKQLVGDPLRLRQIILNLVGNAAKFTENGHITLTVQAIASNSDQMEIEFTVEDTGIGIPEDKLKVIFESFSQASNDTSRKFGGTGLGLTISKSLVEMQGGTISVKSKLSEGSAFTFSIPFKLKTEAPAGLPKEARPAPTSLADLHVLLAEDNEINQLLIVKVLNDWGISADVVNNGQEALEHMSKNRYHLVLMDMQMPLMDGYEATAEIRRLEAADAQTPIIALTAHSAKVEIDKCMAAGANAFVSKPFDPDLLYATIKELVKLEEVAGEDQATHSSIDIQALRGMASGNNAFLSEIISMYISSLSEAAQQLDQLAEAQACKQLQALLLELRENVSVIAAQPLQGTLEKAEAALAQEDTVLLQYLLGIASEEYQKVIQLLQHELEAIAP